MNPFIGPNSFFYKFWRALRFLFKGGNWPYLLAALAMAIFLAHRAAGVNDMLTHFAQTELGVRDAEHFNEICETDTVRCVDITLALQKYAQQIKEPIGWQLLAGLVSFFFTCKMYDGIMRIYNQQEDEPVPLGIETSLAIPTMLFFGLFIWAAICFPIAHALPMPTIDFYEKVFPFLVVGFMPAILMCILVSEEFSTMLRPQDWVRTIIGVGPLHYLAILAVPLLATFLVGLVVGLVLHATGLGGGHLIGIIMEETLKIVATGASFLYIRFFIAADEEKPKELDFASQEILGEARKYHLIGNLEAQQAFASEMRTVDYLFAQQGSEQAEAILLNYVGDDYPVDVYFSAYRRLYHYYRQPRNQGRLQELLQRLQRCAADGDESSYQLIRPELEKRADIEPERIPPDLVHPLCQLALRLEDYDMVLALTRNFAQRAPEHKQIADNYHLAARALARSGRAAAAQQLLEQLLQRFPDHPRRAAFQRTLEQIRSA